MSQATRIYLVDDHQMILDGIKAMLNSTENYSFVGESNDGQSAFEAISDQSNQIDFSKY